MTNSIPGIHHITAIAGPAQENLDFYAEGLGLRLVKTTVNFDDPGTYHFYFGDAVGRPGSILTFFPWAHAAPGQTAAGTVSATAFAVPDGALAFWGERLEAIGARRVTEPVERFGVPVLRFRDPHGLPLELVATTEAGERGAWTTNAVGAPHAIRGFHSATLALRDVGPTAELLTDVFGFAAVGEEDGRYRFAGDGEWGHLVDLVASDRAARMGAGAVHHIAFRARDDEEQKAWQARLRARGFHVTEVKDRQYFKSIYFREPGGVLFEIATDAPGFLRDEAEEELGRELKLPPWLEVRRAEIERRLPPITYPASSAR